MLPSSSIKVGVRTRPLGYNELRDGCQSCVGFPGGDEIIIGGTKQFTFDYVFSDQSTQQEIYESAVRDIIGNLFIGYNVTVLAYGQTGSGKTYTMGTNSSNSLISPDAGIIPRTIYDIYKYLDEVREQSQISVKVSFIEVYNEEIFDLLSNSKEIRTIREENLDVKMPGLIEQTVHTIEDIFKCLLKGSENRSVGSTAMNETSSRSHAIFTIYFSIVPISKDGVSDPMTSKLQLVDLAGSERCSKTGATGDRFKEGVNINRGLLALGSVISALVERDRFKDRQKHVPYRESKLTRLLQDSLGGNTKTLMLACISPADSNFEETATTLNYAARARMIQNKAVINKVSSAQGEIFQLRAQVTALKAQLKDSNMGTPEVCASVSASQTIQIHELNTKLVKMQRERLQLLEEFDDEMNKKDYFLKKLWMKMDREDIEKDEVLDELDRYMQDIMAKEEPDETDVDDDKRMDGAEEAVDNVNKKSDILRSLREELENKEQKLENTEHDLQILQHYEEKNRELEQRIKELEEERSRKSHNNRQEEVEAQLKEARRQLIELQRLKKEKDIKTDEVNQLRQKINELKTSIVRVTKDMQKEKAIFKKMAADKDKEFKTLVNKDRQLHCQMERQAIQHAKETAVLKRKLESGAANERRLKELLENRKNFSKNRISRSNMNKNMNSQVIHWVRQNVDQAVVISETKQRFEKLFDKRRKLTAQLLLLDDDRDGDTKAQVEQEIKSINDCLTLQQGNVTEPNYDHEPVINWSQLRNINEYRFAMKYLFHQMVQERVNNVMNEIEMQDLRAQNTALEEVNGALNSEIEKTRSKYEEQEKKAMKKRRTTMAQFQGDASEIVSEPSSKKKKYQDSDADSVKSRLSRASSRRSSRVSTTCRCKHDCKPTRCGCLRNDRQCSKQCFCRGECCKKNISDSNDDLSDKENACNRTFVNIVQSDEDNELNVTICNRTFDEVLNNKNSDKTNYFPNISNSNRNV